MVAPVIKPEEAMADPKAEVIGVKAQAFGAAELMQHLHGHMAAELAVAALQQQRQPGTERIGPQAPQAALRHFTELAGIVIGAGPVQLQRQAVFQFQQSGGRALPQLLAPLLTLRRVMKFELAACKALASAQLLPRSQSVGCPKLQHDETDFLDDEPCRF